MNKALTCALLAGFLAAPPVPALARDTPITIRVELSALDLGSPDGLKIAQPGLRAPSTNRAGTTSNISITGRGARRGSAGRRCAIWLYDNCTACKRGNWRSVDAPPHGTRRARVAAR